MDRGWGSSPSPSCIFWSCASSSSIPSNQSFIISKHVIISLLWIFHWLKTLNCYTTQKSNGDFHKLESFLSSCVPNLKLDDLIFNLHKEGSKFDSDSDFILFSEFVLSKSHQKGTPSNTWKFDSNIKRHILYYFNYLFNKLNCLLSSQISFLPKSESNWNFPSSEILA